MSRKVCDRFLKPFPICCVEKAILFLECDGFVFWPSVKEIPDLIPDIASLILYLLSHCNGRQSDLFPLKGRVHLRYHLQFDPAIGPVNALACDAPGHGVTTN
jgi:hypothetical protein